MVTVPQITNVNKIDAIIVRFRKFSPCLLLAVSLARTVLYYALSTLELLFFVAKNITTLRIALSMTAQLF
jgi:hypothetical protein